MPVLFLGPVVVYALLFFAYPLIFGVVMSFENFSFAALVKGSGPFVGFANYRSVLSDPVTLVAFRNTVIFTIASVFFQVVISLGLAMLLNQRFFLSGFLRRLVLVPWLVPMVATGTIFAQLFGAQNSLADGVLRTLGITHQPVGWLIHYGPAMVVLILVNIWAGLPFNTIVFYSGLQDLDQTVYEAARVDGANAWQRLLHVTLPMLRPVILIVTMIGIVATVKVFDLVVVITGGGPNNATQLLSTYAYTQAFTNFNFGQGAALGNILLLLSIIVAVFYIRTLGKENA